MHADRTLPADKQPTSESPAFWGYQLKDEPDASEFPGLSANVTDFAGARPGKLVFINLLPNYASSVQLGTDTYGKVNMFVALFVSFRANSSQTLVECWLDHPAAATPCCRARALCLDQCCHVAFRLDCGLQYVCLLYTSDAADE